MVRSFTLYHTVLSFNDTEDKAFENIVGNVFYPNAFFHPSKKKFNFSVTFILSSANAFSFEEPNILSFGKDLTNN